MIKILLSAAVIALSKAHNIVDYGALEDSTENTTRAFINSQALTQAIIAANSSLDDRTVVIPSNQSFVMMPVAVSNLWNVTLLIDGTIFASQDYQSWNRSIDGKSY